jgi:hypothetical protein
MKWSGEEKGAPRKSPAALAVNGGKFFFQLSGTQILSSEPSWRLQ